MATVLHIDGLPVGPQPFNSEPGESLFDLVKRLGGTIWLEQVPDSPQPLRKLDPRVADFLRDYEREDPDSVLAVYWRYHFLDAEEFDSVEEARRFLEGGAEYGSLAGEAIVEGDRIEVLP